jgi:hypothetical protein
MKDENMWFEDTNGNKVYVADPKTCTKCDETYCNCDADEDGLNMCINHKSHPIIDGEVKCMWTEIKNTFPEVSEDIIYEYIYDGYAGDEAIKKLATYITKELGRLRKENQELALFAKKMKKKNEKMKKMKSLIEEVEYMECDDGWCCVFCAKPEESGTHEKDCRLKELLEE